MNNSLAAHLNETDPEDNDMDYETSNDHDDSEEDVLEFEDATEDQDEESEEELDDGDDDDDEIDTRARAVQIARLLQGRIQFNRNMIFRLSSGNSAFVEIDRYPRRPPPHYSEIDPVPSAIGQELMRSGDFGSNELQSYGAGGASKPTKGFTLSRRLLEREIGSYVGERGRILNQLMAQSMLPSSEADFIIHYDNRSYSGQFSEDGNFFYSCSQDFQVRMYDTSNPYEWKYYKSVDYIGGRWTITDATLSPDNNHLAYSSIASCVFMANTNPGNDEIIPLELSHGERGNINVMDPHYGIWSVRFSGDGREIVAGASDSCLYVYDIETRTPILKLQGHEEDVNAVCYGDQNSPHILYSGSDDTTIKVWDRRSMADGREVGVFAGHTEGLTYVDSKGDGRYVLSNAKDQTMKKMMDPKEFDGLPHFNYSSGFDYRSQMEPPIKLPHDSSLVTYRGHSVHKTLIRCHFSPPTSTGSRYVYTGSSDGKAKIYNLDATIAGEIDVNAATLNTRPVDERSNNSWYRDWDEGSNSRTSWKTCEKMSNKELSYLLEWVWIHYRDSELTHLEWWKIKVIEQGRKGDREEI
ncbi:uncharacterized protein H6S33_002740 [Morchella sextelata]|uniref:uncharacterized protein n=1 Tax=Morchella sextelata TaxID=1174677 RepID=UPI001D04035D|nr:uncharacterized protein H6S33_002740 [Morchella sextelata]KAH0607706.1 hypothetical protein H6S33_002740 [Morchella sextelata]